VQPFAFQALAARDKTAQTEALLDAARSDQPSTRLRALQLLDQSGYPDNETALSVLADALTAGLKDGDPMIRGYAIQALATRGGDEAMGYLHQALSNPNPSVRATVLSSVAGKDEMRPLVDEALSDPDQSVSRLAAFLLQQTGTNGGQRHVRDWR